MSMADEQHAALQQAMPGIPPDVLRDLLTMALAAEGDSLAAWLRLSRVCRLWRDSLAGATRTCRLYQKYVPYRHAD